MKMYTFALILDCAYLLVFVNLFVVLLNKQTKNNTNLDCLYLHCATDCAQVEVI